MGGEVEEEERGGRASAASFWAWCNVNDDKKAYGAVVLTRLIYAGMFLVQKAAFDGGLNPAIFVFYRQAFATLCLAPLAFSLEWKDAPKLSLLTFCEIFVLALVGITLALNLNGVGLLYTSSTLAAASLNSLPVTTFLLALLLRVETLRVGTKSGKVKLLGLVICMGGVATLAFYEGPHFKMFCLFKHSFWQSEYHESHTSWIKGSFLTLSSSFAWGYWLVFQTRLQKSYPPKLLFTTLQCALATIQSFVVAITIEGDLNEWKLGWDVKFVSVVYCGGMVSGVTYYFQAWVLEKKGPVFLAMSTPLAFIFTMICSALLCDFINLGSVLGGMLLVGGLHSVLWAKVKEENEIEDHEKKVTPQVEEQDCTLELKQVVTISTNNLANANKH
ncbi:unnamed protein product [Linum trigynum]|uniref:WAT1-related protein n=1 Tax=Linum trigynum TaxID=586398 RepID=A0AAV2GFI3_9ROSI